MKEGWKEGEGGKKEKKQRITQSRKKERNRTNHKEREMRNQDGKISPEEKTVSLPR